MKKQTNPDIKAHLLRSAFYVLLLVAICVIPFALAQRGVGKRALAPKGTCPTPWTLVADMPLDLEGAAGASDGTYFYSAGGFSSSLFALLDAAVPLQSRHQLLGYDGVPAAGSRFWGRSLLPAREQDLCLRRYGRSSSPATTPTLLRFMTSPATHGRKVLTCRT